MLCAMCMVEDHRGMECVTRMTTSTTPSAHMRTYISIIIFHFFMVSSRWLLGLLHVVHSQCESLKIRAKHLCMSFALTCSAKYALANHFSVGFFKLRRSLFHSKRKYGPIEIRGAPTIMGRITRSLARKPSTPKNALY